MASSLVPREGAAHVPEVTVVVPAWCLEEWVGACVRSALSQDVDLELVVVDDHSPDGTVAAATEAIGDDARARVLRNAGAKGGDGARNTGLDAARAPWIVFLDGDDELVPGALRRLLDAATSDATADGRVVGALGTFHAENEDGSAHPGGWEREQRDALARHPGAALDLFGLCRDAMAPPPGAMVLRTDAVREAGGWEEGAGLGGLATDFELLARVAARGELRVTRHDVLRYRVREGSLSRQDAHPRALLRARLLAIRRAPRHARPGLGIAIASRSAGLAARRSRRAVATRSARIALHAASNLAQAVGFVAFAALCWVAPPSTATPARPSAPSSR